MWGGPPCLQILEELVIFQFVQLFTCQDRVATSKLLTCEIETRGLVLPLLFYLYFPRPDYFWNPNTIYHFILWNFLKVLLPPPFLFSVSKVFISHPLFLIELQLVQCYIRFRVQHSDGFAAYFDGNILQNGWNEDILKLPFIEHLLWVRFTLILFIHYFIKSL